MLLPRTTFRARLLGRRRRLHRNEVSAPGKTRRSSSAGQCAGIGKTEQSSSTFGARSKCLSSAHCGERAFPRPPLRYLVVAACVLLPLFLVPQSEASQLYGVRSYPSEPMGGCSAAAPSTPDRARERPAVRWITDPFPTPRQAATDCATTRRAGSGAEVGRSVGVSRVGRSHASVGRWRSFAVGAVERLMSSA